MSFVVNINVCKSESAMETIQTDILIVGAGLAGFTAAVRAVGEGAKVLLIEKSTASWAMAMS